MKTYQSRSDSYSFPPTQPSCTTHPPTPPHTRQLGMVRSLTIAVSSASCMDVAFPLSSSEAMESETTDVWANFKQNRQGQPQLVQRRDNDPKSFARPQIPVASEDPGLRTKSPSFIPRQCVRTQTLLNCVCFFVVTVSYYVVRDCRDSQSPCLHYLNAEITKNDSGQDSDLTTKL